jgi:hypothetical protein
MRQSNPASGSADLFGTALATFLLGFALSQATSQMSRGTPGVKFTSGRALKPHHLRLFGPVRRF